MSDFETNNRFWEIVGENDLRQIPVDMAASDRGLRWLLRKYRDDSTKEEHIEKIEHAIHETLHALSATCGFGEDQFDVVIQRCEQQLFQEKQEQ